MNIFQVFKEVILTGSLYTLFFEGIVENHAHSSVELSFVCLIIFKTNPAFFFSFLIMLYRHASYFWDGFLWT